MLSKKVLYGFPEVFLEADDKGAGGSGDEAAAAVAKADKEAADKAEADRVKGLSVEELAIENATLRRENAERRKKLEAADNAAEAAAKEKEESDRKKAEEAGQHKELYELEKQRTESLTTENEKLKSAVDMFYQTEIEGLPDGIKDSIPEQLDIPDRLVWLGSFKANNPQLFEAGGKGPGYKPPGENNKTTLEAKLAEAEKSGNQLMIVSLKRQIWQAQNKGA